MDRSKLYRRFRTLLIANRGEIAARVIRSARAMGLRTVAVYSEADRDAMHVAMADEAVLLGPARARDSYLNIERVIDAARRTGAEAVHPGYGFLSENAEFAQACLDAGLVFVGPTAAMMTAMGSKSGSKALMEKAGVPLVPGYHGAAQDEAILADAADKIGFPVLVKASAGGGGRGMRVVNSAAELAAAVTSAKREAKAAFGDDRMLIEKFVQNPRHIEVQIIGDSHGNLLSLFERECTLQRRHQKVIEEAPSPTLDATQREAVCAAARKAAGAVNYVGAGTIEFVSDGRDVFFIEMNTRLQVEHPVTELITGIDLVEWQLRVAFGENLPLAQDEIRLNGHAIEARVYAENPQKNFMPSVGRIKTWRTPEANDGLRIDAGYRSGDAVSPYYDAMLAKVIAWAPTRALALRQLSGLLRRARIHGLRTNRDLLVNVLRHHAFLDGETDTAFFDTHGLAALAAPLIDGAAARLSAVAAAIAESEHNRATATALPGIASGWRNLSSGNQVKTFADSDGTEHRVEYRFTRDGVLLPEDQGVHLVSATPSLVVLADTAGAETAYEITSYGDLRFVDSPLGSIGFTVVPRFVEPGSAVQEGSLVAPMPGLVIRVGARAGDTVTAGQPLLWLEAMKMEHTITAPRAGVLAELNVTAGQQVEVGAVLARVTTEGDQ